MRSEAKAFGLEREAGRQVFVTVEHGGDEVVFFVESVEEHDGNVQDDKDDGDLGELFVDVGEIVAKRWRDEGSERTLKEEIVVGEQADEGSEEEDSEEREGCERSQGIVSYVGIVLLEEGSQAGDDRFAGW